MPPGPRPVPFFGNVLALRGHKKEFKQFYKLSKTYGPVMTFYMGQIRMIVLSGVKEIQEAMVNKGKVFDKRPIHIIPGLHDLPTGVLLSSNEKWQENRRFALKALRDFGMGKAAILNNIQDEVEHLLGALESNVGQELDQEHLLLNSVSNVICSLVFGKRFEYDDVKFENILRAIAGVSRVNWASRFMEFFLPFLTYAIPPSIKKAQCNLNAHVDRMLREAIRDHRETFSPDHLRDLPDYYIQAEVAQNDLDFENFVNICADLFIAGSETTSTLLNWTLIYVSIHKSIQYRCQSEIDKVIQSNRLPCIEDRPKLVYIDAVLNEIMRFITITPRALFHANREAASIGEYEIPENSMIMYNIWGVHHDPGYWVEPEKFDPDRWIDDDGKLLSHSSHFIPFGVGPRYCIGELLAKAESFIFLVAILHRFKFSIAAESCNLSLENDGNSGVTHTPPPCKLVVQTRYS